MGLSRLPRPKLHQLRDLTPDQPQGFLRLRRRELSLERGPERSRPFVIDSVDRRALDAVVIAAHFGRGADAKVFLRSSVRPAIALRQDDERDLAARETCLWELPAGLVEEGEDHPAGRAACAARETQEELGFDLPAARFSALGHPLYPAAGLIGELLYFFAVEVDPTARSEPSLDGSVLEQDALIEAIAVDEAVQLCREGTIADAKTEIGLRRLREALA